MREILINGKWIKGNESTAVHSPFSGELIAEVSMADEDQLSQAFEAASRAAAEMNAKARFEIAQGIKKIAAAIEQRKNDLVETIIAESAKPLRYASAEVDRAIAAFSFAAGEAERYCGEVVPVDTQASGTAKTAFTKRVPRGVIYGITPFNFPLNLVAHKVAPALASGNAVIIKPSDKTPLTSLLLGEIFLESGLPPAALQIVPMNVGYIDRVYSDDRVNMISFTGSAPVGWSIKAKAAKKFVTLELGGNAAVIVDKSADIERSVAKCVTGSFAYSGQVCISVQRIFVHNDLFDEWTERFVENTGKLKFGDPANDDTDISVMIDEASAKRAESWIKEATDNGAKKLFGGERSESYLPPTVLTETSPEMKIVSEEAFAPVVVIEKAPGLEDAVDMANSGKYGLQAGVFTDGLQGAITAAGKLEYGGVIINDVPTFRVDNMPYGGVKDSGFGREGIRYAMDEMTEPRLIVISG